LSKVPEFYKVRTVAGRSKKSIHYGGKENAPPGTILIGTYRCKKWIQENNLYNFPLFDDGDLPKLQRVGWVFLENIRNSKAELMKFRAVFDREVTVADLKKLNYPVAPRHDKYALFKLVPLEADEKLPASGIARQNKKKHTVVVSLGELAKGESDRAAFTHWLHNIGTPFAKTYEEHVRKLIKPSLMRILAESDVTVLKDGQGTFIGALLGVPFPPPEKPKFTFIDLFAGIGGFRIAMQNLGGKCVFSSEWDTSAQKTYEANFGEFPYGDITKPETKAAIPDGFDILCAGFPCQPFSIIGDKEGFQHETQGNLFFDIEAILRGKKPRAFFLENVRNLTAHEGGSTFKIIMSRLHDLGYRVHAKVLNALDYGVPQKRERIMICGFREDVAFSFPPPIPYKARKTLHDILEQNIDARYFVKPNIKASRIERMKREITKPYITHENVGGTITPHHFSCALRAGASANYLLVNNERRPTEREMLRIQGFPDDYKIVVSYGELRKQAGNSVAVPVIQAVAAQMLSAINLSHSTNNEHLTNEKSKAA